MSDLSARLRLTICAFAPAGLTEDDENRIHEAVMPIVGELAADLDHAERENRRLQAEVHRLKGERA